MGANDFTDRENQIMACAWRCFEGDPKVDFKKLAGLVGMTNPASATNAWARIKKKIAAQAAEVMGDADADENAKGHSTTSTPKAKATPKKRAKKEVDEDDEDAGGSSPTKVRLYRFFYNSLSLTYGLRRPRLHHEAALRRLLLRVRRRRRSRRRTVVMREAITFSDERATSVW
jgi:hypothetical protein